MLSAFSVWAIGALKFRERGGGGGHCAFGLPQIEFVRQAVVIQNANDPGGFSFGSQECFW